jgi:hypothetical protein
MIGSPSLELHAIHVHSLPIPSLGNTDQSDCVVRSLSQGSEAEGLKHWIHHMIHMQLQKGIRNQALD